MRILNGKRTYRKELIIVADDEIEAVRLANDSEYGLGASIWTEDLDKAEKLSRLVRSGMVTVNNVDYFTIQECLLVESSTVDLEESCQGLVC